MSLKDKATTGLGTLLSVVLLVAGWFMGLSLSLLLIGFGFIIHISTIVIAMDTSGIVAAIVSLIFPVFAQIYWIIYLWRETGIFLTPFTILNLAYVGIIIFIGGAMVIYGLIVSVITDKQDKKKREKEGKEREKEEGFRK